MWVKDVLGKHGGQRTQNHAKSGVGMNRRGNALDQCHSFGEGVTHSERVGSGSTQGTRGKRFRFLSCPRNSQPSVRLSASGKGRGLSGLAVAHAQNTAAVARLSPSCTSGSRLLALAKEHVGARERPALWTCSLKALKNGTATGKLIDSYQVKHNIRQRYFTPGELDKLNVMHSYYGTLLSSKRDTFLVHTYNLVFQRTSGSDFMQGKCPEVNEPSGGQEENLRKWKKCVEQSDCEERAFIVILKTCFPL
ncbi:uncharacterized protein LOC106029128 [Cavia porcellus]|uniref:uncharacterized protein LOC106029128 n=1 Tax=Cavia porcellus TaxID=10141 RepID=UPI002FE15474